MGPMVSNLYNAHPDTFLPLFVHLSDGYQTAWGNTRANYYDVEFIPHNMYDGLFESNNLTADYNARSTIPTNVTMDIHAFGAERDWNVSVDVCVEAGATATHLMVHIVQVLDYYPFVEPWYRNCVRKAATPEYHLVEPDTCVTIETSFSLANPSFNNLENVKFAAFAQDSADIGPAEVYQAAQVAQPFGVFEEGFESGDLSGWSSVTQ